MKYEEPSWKRWDPKPEFYSVIHHPATPGNHYVVRHGVTGEPFQAWYSHGREWFKVLPDANGDGTRELGDKIGITLDLQWKGTLLGNGETIINKS